MASFTDAALNDEKIIGLIIASIILFGAALLLLKNNSSKKGSVNDSFSGDTWAHAAVKSATKNEEVSDNSTGTATKNVEEQNNNIPPTTSGDDGELRNVFSVKQKPINTGKGSGATTSSDRPFESSYYFAHNKHSTGGGYKDGLRAEDYVMNGPKLLSKGGVRVDDKPTATDTNDAAETDSKESPIAQQTERNNATDNEKPKPKLTSSTPITKYMWDDDSNGNIAKIHIDSLPNNNNTSTSIMKWEDANITKEQVQVRFIGDNNEGLYIGIQQQGKNYHLLIHKMFGDAEAVKSIVKKHKLLIKITKKKVVKTRYSNRHKAEEDGIWSGVTKAFGKLAGGDDSSKNDEYVSAAWPRLSASSTGGLSGGTTDIDEKMFKKMDVQNTSGSDDFAQQYLS